VRLRRRKKREERRKIEIFLPVFTGLERIGVKPKLYTLIEICVSQEIEMTQNNILITTINDLHLNCLSNIILE
jgi:hypothetical protein